MPVSFSNANPANMELSPCKVSFGGTELGGTVSNVKVAINFEKAEMKVDQLGNTVVDRRVSGLNIKIETVLSEISDKDKWKVAFPNAKKVGTGPYSVYFESRVGESDIALALPLVLHPLSKADADKSSDMTFFKATAESVSEVVYSPTEQQGLKVVWNVYLDMGTTPARFAMYGDTAIGLIHASAGAPTFVGTGTGLMTAVSVFDGYTLTEAIHCKCVGVPAADKSNWLVSGSVSGVIGYFEIGVSGSATFASSKVAFTVADGATDFVLNDEFTVNTVAANFV
jgi:hypothetical protein